MPTLRARAGTAFWIVSKPQKDDHILLLYEASTIGNRNYGQSLQPQTKRGFIGNSRLESVEELYKSQKSALVLGAKFGEPGVH